MDVSNVPSGITFARMVASTVDTSLRPCRCDAAWSVAQAPDRKTPDTQTRYHPETYSWARRRERYAHQMKHADAACTASLGTVAIMPNRGRADRTSLCGRISFTYAGGSKHGSLPSRRAGGLHAAYRRNLIYEVGGVRTRAESGVPQNRPVKVDSGHCAATGDDEFSEGATHSDKHLSAIRGPHHDSASRESQYGLTR